MMEALRFRFFIEFTFHRLNRVSYQTFYKEETQREISNVLHLLPA